MANSDQELKHSLLDRFISSLIPVHFSQSQDFFKVKVLTFFSLTVGGLGILILTGLSLGDGEVPLRRYGTVILASLLLAVVVLVRITKNIQVVGWYVVICTVSVVWYVDFNNQSILGPNTPLWLVPIALSALIFRHLGLLLAVSLILGLFVFDLLLLSKGYLPEPIVRREVWSSLESVQLVLAAVVIAICTRGVSKLAAGHMGELELELEEKQQRIQEINELKVHAEASTRSKTMFLATMSHELRTPLNSVIGNAQLLKAEDLPEKVRDRVSDISTAGNLLLMLINDILDFSKLEQNELNLIPSTYCISDQLTELCRMMEARVKSGVGFHQQVPADVYIHGDKNRLAQVFMNLLSNAIKFTERGDITVGIETPNPKDCHVWVNDTGIGIREQDLDKLFMQFSQVAGDSARNMEGTGLGLAISKGIVDKMGGEIRVESQFGEGTKFTIFLPNCLTMEKPTEPSRPTDSGTLNLSNSTILVVDDIEMNCVVLEGMLLQFGAENISSVGSGEAAIDYLDEHPETDMVLMDLRMPGMSGDEATEVIRKNGYQGKVIAVTANATDDDRHLCMKAGMDGFLAKPVVMEELKSVIQQFQ